MMESISSRSETICVNVVLRIVFECTAICNWILAKRHFIWEYGFSSINSKRLEFIIQVTRATIKEGYKISIKITTVITNMNSIVYCSLNI